VTFPTLDPEHVQALGVLLAAFSEVEIIGITPHLPAHAPADSPHPEIRAAPEQADLPIDPAEREPA